MRSRWWHQCGNAGYQFERREVQLICLCPVLCTSVCVALVAPVTAWLAALLGLGFHKWCLTPIYSSSLATYVPQVVQTKHTDYLPSLNLRWEIEPKLIGRLGITKTLGRANYNELAGAVSLNNTLLTGTSGNPRLAPTTSTNVDASLAYYFARRAYVSGAVFAQDIKDYVKPGSSNVEYFNTSTNTFSTYLVTSRVAVVSAVNDLSGF
jgi:outer membrane receptor protein involved in Fe transport